MKTVFADASYWVALLNPRDQLHSKAKSFPGALGLVHLITTEMGLTEFLNDYARRHPLLRRTAVELVRRLQQDPNSTIISQTSDQFANALALYADRNDKKWGLTDCASFVAMRDRGILEALTYDKHFQQMGFRALLRE